MAHKFEISFRIRDNFSNQTHSTVHTIAHPLFGSWVNNDPPADRVDAAERQRRAQRVADDEAESMMDMGCRFPGRFEAVEVEIVR